MNAIALSKMKCAFTARARKQCRLNNGGIRRAQRASLLAALFLPAVVLAGCKGFWSAPSGSTSFTLSNSGNISVSPGNSGTSTITVTPTDSFTGTVTLSCSVSAPTGATSPATCDFSSSSLSITSTTAVTSTMTVSTSSSTTTGTYNITVTGTSDSVSNTTELCAEVSSTSATCSVSSSSSVFYVLNQGTKQIAAYSVSSGTPTAIGTYTLSSAPYSIAVAPSGSFLYVGTTAGIYMYKIGSTGTLAVGNGGAAISADIATTMQVDSTGKWLVEAGSNVATLFAIPISTSTGLQSSSTEQSIALPSASVEQLCISADNNYVFVADGSSGTERITFSSASSDPFGTKLAIPVRSSGGAALSVAVDPENRLFYVGETAATSGTNTGGLRIFSYSTSSELSGSPFSTGGLSPYSIVPLQYGTYADEYVYVLNHVVTGSAYGNVSGFQVTGSSGSYSLSALSSTATAGINPMAMAQDSTGAYLLAVNYGGSPDLSGYTFDSSSAGTLDSAFTSSTGTDPVEASAIAVRPQ